MDRDELIPLELYCSTTQVEITFLESLIESGLVQLTVEEERRYIPAGQLSQVDRLVRLHDDLGINVEGIEAIEHLLARIQRMQEEMQALRNRMRRFGEAP